MHNVHGFALFSEALKHPAAPVMAAFCEVHATALKAMHKAGRRGGDSIAREGCKHVCGGCASGTEAGAAAMNESEALKTKSPAKRV
ncbi:hypothetical protein [Pantoea agglomerans]|uniref:hypothetical protein n=1 Tax=Enterobacter agglomerans TaxID=549 RepID=UPI003BF5B615